MQKGLTVVLDVIEDKNYKSIIENQIFEIVAYLLNSDQEFSITANIKSVSFEPEIPKSISKSFPNFTLFTLSNYTYESTQVTPENISFEAGFGEENFGSVVTIPLSGIFQIVIDESILYLNPTATVEKFFIEKVKKDEIEALDPVSRSMNAFKLNSKNKNLF